MSSIMTWVLLDCGCEVEVAVEVACLDAGIVGDAWGCIYEFHRGPARVVAAIESTEEVLPTPAERREARRAAAALMIDRPERPPHEH